MSAITFAAPRLLWLAALVPLALLYLFLRERQRVAAARRFVSERLRGVANPARALRPLLIAMALLAGVVAVAGPQAGFTVVPVEQRESNRVLVIDVSLSMLAEDVGTSRLDAAKAIAKRIIAAHQGRVGLVIFEQSADVVSPLTSDGDAVGALIDSINAGEIGLAGSDTGAALVKAARLLDADATHRGDLVLISDGEDQGTRTDEEVAKLGSRGIAVSTIAVGTPGGATIPDQNARGPLRDDNGEVVTTAAHPDALRRIASATGGEFFDNPFAEHALDSLAASGGTTRRTTVRVPIERYQWPLALAMLFLFLGSLTNRGAE
jgi:Ca-activated chloride channel family protein